MFFRHPNTEMNNQLLAVASYAAIGDCLTEVYNRTPDEEKGRVDKAVDELKMKLNTEYASHFIQYVNSVARRLGMQDEMIKKRETYLRICNQLMAPTPEQREEFNKLFSSYYYDREHGRQEDQIEYLLRCFVDSCAVGCLQKIIDSAPDRLKSRILGGIFPKAVINMLHVADDSMLEFMLQAGMKADSYISWTNFLRYTTEYTLLTAVTAKLGTRIHEADNLENQKPLTEKEMQVYGNIITKLRAHQVNPDIDEDYVGDPATPRGLAKNKLRELEACKNIPEQHKQQMSAVLHLIIDAPRVKEFQPRVHMFEPMF